MFTAAALLQFPPRLGWPAIDTRYIVLALIALAVIVAVVLAIRFIAKAQRKDRRQRLGVELDNRGNAPSRYELRADSGGPALEFGFWLAGRQLPEQLYAVPIAFSESTAAGADVAAEQAGDREGGIAGARQSTRKALGVAGAITNLLTSLIAIVPGPWQASLKKATGEMKKAANTAARVEQLPDQVAKIKTAAVQPGAAPAAAPGGQTGTTTAAAVSTPMPSRPTVVVQQAWAQTPSVQPGSRLVLELVVGTAERWRREEAGFTVYSRSADQVGALPLIETGKVEFPSVSWGSRYGPYLAVLAAAVAVLAYAYWLVSVAALGR